MNELLPPSHQNSNFKNFVHKVAWSRVHITGGGGEENLREQEIMVPEGLGKEKER